MGGRCGGEGIDLRDVRRQLNGCEEICCDQGGWNEGRMGSPTMRFLRCPAELQTTHKLVQSAPMHYSLNMAYLVPPGDV